jgi:TPR repeat protein
MSQVMKFAIKGFLFFMSGFVLLASVQTLRADFEDDSLPFGDMPDAASGRLSSNWVAAVKAAVPAKYFASGELSFEETTNLLRAESERGNNAAKGLWGIALVAQKGSQKDTEAGLQLLRESAEKGYVPAMLNLGYLYERGEYVTTNYDEAFHWFTLAAEKGNSEGELQLGGCYHYGFGTVNDLPMTAKWYRRSAEHTNYVAMKSLGYLLMNGYGVNKDLKEANYWFTRAANEGGNRRAMYNLGVICDLKFPDTNSMVESFRWLKKSGDLGDALAALQLSYCYQRGWGVESNVDSYHSWRLKAATLGATEAEYAMGVAYRTGDGVLQDTELSLVWYQKAASKNDPRAFYDLALHYLEDKTSLSSKTLAKKYMLQAAEHGHREAQFQCAMSCFRDDVELRDCEGGRKWLAKSAENGWSKAEFALFRLYFYGIPPAKECPAYPKDKAEAVKWIRRAAEHGNLKAQATLAIMLIRGEDVEQNKAEAERLLRYAAEHGYASAQNDLGYAIINSDLSSGNAWEAAMWCKLAESRSDDTNTAQRAHFNLDTALSQLSEEQKQELQRRVKKYEPLSVPELDPMIKGWERAPDYQQEDGRFGH